MAQTESVIGDVAANVDMTCAIVARASSAGASLVVLPELSLTGYDLARLGDDHLWFTTDDPRLDRIRTECAATGVTAVVGAPVLHASVVGAPVLHASVVGAPVLCASVVREPAADRPRSGGGGGSGRPLLASLVITPDGSVVVAPKKHLHGDEVAWFEPGDGPTLVEVDGWRVATAVCLDTSVPDHAAEAAGAGAHLYAGSVLYVQGEERSLADRMAARARDNAIAAIAANTAGHPLGLRSAGGSGAWAPDGSVVAVADGRDDEVVVVTLEP